MSTITNEGLIQLVWHFGLYPLQGLTTTDGQSVQVIESGESDLLGDNYVGAKIVLGDVVCRGEVVFGGESAVCDASAILHVVAKEGVRVAYESGEFLPQLVIPLVLAVEHSYQRLLEGASSFWCGRYISGADPFRRVSFFTRLLLERLERKENDLLKLHLKGGDDWNHTLYLLLFQVMGSPYNKEPFTKLAQTVPWSAVLKERGSPPMIEALLLGASGFLEMREQDDNYVSGLKRDFEYLRTKHQIVPLKPSVWSDRGNPYGMPVLRIAQLAAFLSDKEFVFDRLMELGSGDQVRDFFEIQASEYWSTHFQPSRLSTQSPKRIGRDRADVFGINMVAPLMFAYARWSGDEAMQNRAVELLEKIAPEANYITKGWGLNGVEIVNAFDSQALIQLTNEYCKPRLCAQCPIGRQVVKRAYEKFS